MLNSEDREGLVYMRNGQKKVDYLYNIDNLYANITDDSEKFWIKADNQKIYISKEEFMEKRDELLNSSQAISVSVLDCSRIAEMRID